MNKFVSKLRGTFKSRLAGERSVPAAITALIICVVILFNAVVYALDVLYGLYLYSANNADLSLSSAVDGVFTDDFTAGRQVKILFCQPEEDVKNSATGGWVYQTAKNLADRYSFITLDFVNIMSDPDLVLPYRTDKTGHEYTILSSSVIFVGETNFRVVTDISTNAGYADFYTLDSNLNVLAYNGEEVMVSMILWAMADTHPTAYFTIYHGETTSTAFANLLTCAGYYINTWDLRSGEVPDDAELLIVANPQSDFEQAVAGSGVRSEMERLKDYVEDGGNVYVSVDPYLKKSLPVLSSFLKDYGLEISRTESEGKKLALIVRDRENAITTDGFTLVLNTTGGTAAEKIASHIREADAGNVIISSAASLTLGENAHALLTSSASSTEEADGKVIDRAGSYPVIAYGEKAGSGTVVLVPSIYLTAPDALVSQGYANKDFFYGIFEELYGAGKMPYGCRDLILANSTLENLTMGAARRWTALLFLLPVALTAVAFVVIIRRKNR